MEDLKTMHMDKKQFVAGVFDRSAATYDSIGPGFFAYFGKRMVDLADIPEGARVLDIASGRGASLFPACEAAGCAGRVTGIDIARSMVESSSREIEHRSIKNAEITVMDAEQLSFADNSFDLVLCGFCLFFFPAPERAIAEFFRVLKPGGKIILTTWGKTDTRDWHIELAKKHLVLQAGAKPLPRTVERNFEDPEDVRIILSNAGFGQADVVTETKDFFYSNEEEWWETQYSHGIREVLENVERLKGKDGLERFKADALARLRELKTPEGFRQTMKVYYNTAQKPA